MRIARLCNPFAHSRRCCVEPGPLANESRIQRSNGANRLQKYRSLLIS